MKKKYKIALSISTLLLFSACGDDSSSSTPIEIISKKESVAVVFNTSENFCKSKEFYRSFQVLSDVKDLYITVAPNNTTCAVYNKTEGNNCAYAYRKDASNVSCVVGWNSDSTNNINNKPSYEDKLILTDNIIEKVILFGE